MLSPTIIYLGPQDLQAQVLATYFSNMNCSFWPAKDTEDLLAAVQNEPRSVVVLAQQDAPSKLLRLARQVIRDPSNAFPHVFILYEGEPFDPQLEAITVISGARRISGLADHIRVLLRRLPAT